MGGFFVFKQIFLVSKLYQFYVDKCQIGVYNVFVSR